MPGLHPLQNAQPKQQIPNEAPKFFNTFFEQPAKPAPVTIWQPPPMVGSLRSKATNRERNPFYIPTAGTWAPKPVVKEPVQTKGLFQLHKPKKSVDEIMWLGAVTGFEVKEELSMRSKLVRKPETIPSQASAATGPKATEAREKKEGAERARERRLAEWASKKKPVVSGKKAGDAPAGASASVVLPQPIESRLRPRSKKVYTPVHQTADRPSAIHRPHLPSHESSSYAPEKRILPQPIETVARSNRPAKKEDTEEGTLWMGRVQPVETSRRSNKRQSPLKKVSGVDDAHDDEQAGKGKASEILPQPIETSSRSNRPGRVSALPKSSETTCASSRKPPATKEFLPEPIETTRKSNRPQRIALPKPFEMSSVRSTKSPVSEKPEGSSVLAEATKAACRPDPTPLQVTSPPTPTTSFFGPDILPQPIETTRRSHRPLGRPLVPQVIETSNRTNRVRPQEPELHLELPETHTLSRWNSGSSRIGRSLRRESTSKPLSPGLYAPPLNLKRGRRQPAKDPYPPADHVLHLHEPIDSAPPSPVGTPDISRCSSPASTSTSSADNMAWEVPVQGARKRGGFMKRENPDESALADYMLGLKQRLEKADVLGTNGRLRERAKEHSEYPVPLTTGSSDSGIVADIDTTTKTTWSLRSNSSETIRPPALASDTCTSDTTKAGAPPSDICKSPVFAPFKRPLNHDLEIDDLDLVNTQLLTPPNSMPRSVAANPAVSAPPRLHYCQAGPSPGYTVASLPPTRRKQTAEEVTPEFVEQVFKYLSMQFENVAVNYDSELVRYTGLALEAVRENRLEAVRVYCERWVDENPEMITGERSKQGFW